MRYMDVGCNINCFECKKECYFKDIMFVSIFIPYFEHHFYSEIIDRLQAQAGQLYVTGICDINILTEEVKTLAVSFYVARQKLKEQLIPKETR